MSWPSMKKPSDNLNHREDIRRKLIGLGEKSLHKSYFPELKARIDQLERFRALLDQSNDAVILMDVSDVQVIDANEAVCNLLGLSKERLDARSLAERVDFGAGLAFPGLWARAQKEAGRKIEGVCHFRSVDGTRHPIEFTAKLVEFGGRDYLVFVGRDISRRIKAEQKNMELQAQLVQAQKMEAIGVLAGGIAHDFNNILTGILGFSELALDQARQGKAALAEIEQVIGSAENARQLIGQILAFSRKAESKLDPMDLNGVIEKLNPMIESTMTKRIAVKLDLDSGLRPVNGNANQMGQVLLNLAANARDAMPGEGRLTIKTENAVLQDEFTGSRPGLEPGEYVRLIVSDTGQGIEPEILEHIFEPFYTTKEAGKGTGLGLASVFGIVQSHGGHISCSSRTGQGTAFTIHFPALDAGVRPEENKAVRDEPGHTRAGSETILLVDDEKLLRELGSQILQGSGYRIVTAANGEEALSIYSGAREEIDLILMDIVMPGMGGVKCLGEILSVSPEAKVILASGYHGEVDHREGELSGAAAYISKPFRKADLLRTIRRVLDA